MKEFYNGIVSRLACSAFMGTLSVAIAIIPTTAARSESSVKLDHEVLITAQHGAVILPRAIVASGKDEFVIAGGIDATRQAWAAKVDLTGKMIWEHAVDILPSDEAVFGKQHGVHPRYAGAVSMADGTTYLCGSMPRPRFNYAPGLLSHIGAKGDILSEKTIMPEQRNALGLVRVEDCKAWRDGIVVLGGVTHFARSEDTNVRFAQNTRRVWIVALDSSGNTVFDVQVESPTDQTIRDPGSVRVLSDGSLVVGLTNNLVSDFIRLDARGTVLAHNSFSGRFLLVRSNDNVVQILGALATPTNDTRAVRLLTLDTQLQPTDKVDGTYARGFGARVVYRLENKGLVLFGSQARGGLFVSGAASGILRMDNRLQAQDYFELPRQRVDDEHILWTASPTSNPGEFALATSAVAHGFDSFHPEKPTDIPNFRLGGALDIVTVK